MPNETSVADSFNEKSKQIDIALKYTDGDMEKAKLMVSGQYKDVKIIKGKFSVEQSDVYGIFFIFINIPNRYIMNLNSLLMPDNTIVSKTNIFSNWKIFYTDFGDYIQKEGNNSLPSYDFITHLSDASSNYDIYTDIEYDSLEILTDKITDIICKYYSVSKVKCQIELDTSSSLVIESAGIPLEQPKGMNDNEDLDTEESQRMEQIEATADYVIDGRVIISPIRGVDINDVKSGEKIKVLLTCDDERTILILKKLSAISEDGEKLPITVRLKEKIPMGKSGFILYGLAAKNVLVRIIEEESVKIETGSIQKTTKTEKKDSDSRIILYLSVLAGFIIILSFFIFLIL